MKSVKVIMKMTEQRVRQSAVSLEPAVRQRLVTDVAAKLDAQFFSVSRLPRACVQNVAVGGPLTYC